MKNYLVLIVFTLSLLPKINAQITLSQSTYPLSVLGTDTLKKTIAASPFPSLVPATNANWDMSTLIDTTPVFYDYRVGSTTHQFADSNYFNFLNFNCQGNDQDSIIISGLLEYGIKILSSRNSLVTITLNPSDSLIILSQYMMYSNPQTIINFPATFGSNWGSDFYSDLNFQLSVSTWGYSHAPGYRHRHTIERDSITGWGKMRVKNIAGLPSSWFDVLQVQITSTTTDSFFLNGAPLNSAYLAAFLLTQGAKSTTYKQNYYRIGEVTPLESVLFTDSTFTHPYSAMTHTQRLVNVGVDEIVENPVVVYPNPVKGNIINVRLPITTIPLAYELVDISGKIIHSGSINKQSGGGEIELPKDIKQGIYVLKIGNGKDVNYIKEITIVR